MVFEIDLAFIARQAQQRADDYEAFRYYVELDARSDRELDQLVEQIAAPIIDAIDCTQCGNCCRHLDVYLTPEDAQRLATGLNCSYADVQDRYINHPQAEQEGEWGMFHAKPCAFLNGNLCTVYAHRPESCRAYPEFTPDFRWQLGHILGGVGSCPIIYHVIELLQRELKW